MAKKIITKLSGLALIIGCLWIAASFIDVVSNNLSDEPVYQSWNAFMWLLRLGGK